MEFMSLVKAALELGVIPTIALALVYSLHLQNRRLTAMIEKKDEHTYQILSKLIGDIAELSRQQRAGER